MPSADLDCLFVHAPKADNHYLPLGDFFNITYLPMGLPALANALRADGWRTGIVHLGLQWLVDPETNIVQLMDGRRIRAIGLSLYWHYQSYDAIEAARALKAAHPEAFVFLGGVTASYFAAEIVREHPFVDAVVKGHGEGPVRALIAALAAGEDPAGVGGLVLLRDGEVVETTGPTPVTTLAELRYGDLSALKDAETYARTFGFPLAYGREYDAETNRTMLSMGRAFFPLMTGRGCPYKCTFCGGNQETLARINGTAKVTWRSHDRVLDDIRAALDHGYRTMSLCFDPIPQKDAWYRTLFERIRRDRLDVDFYFECWGLPTRDFVRDFRRTFPNPESYLAISPDAGDEQVRRLNKQPFYTDEAMFQALDWLREERVSADVFFTLALPGETVQSARRTAVLKARIAADYPNARRIMTWTVQLEPGSPQFERPQDYAMVTDRTCFRDFYNAHGGDRADTYSSLGFKIAGYFGDERDRGDIAAFERHLQHLKCMEFCFLAKDPRRFNDPARGRAHCFERRQRLAAHRGTAAPQLPIGPDVTYFDALAEERALRSPRPRHGWV